MFEFNQNKRRQLTTEKPWNTVESRVAALGVGGKNSPAEGSDERRDAIVGLPKSQRERPFGFRSSNISGTKSSAWEWAMILKANGKTS
jgi:hypothetical protein